MNIQTVTLLTPLPRVIEVRDEWRVYALYCHQIKMPPACIEWQQKLHAKLHVKDKFKTSEGEKWSGFGMEFKHLSTKNVRRHLQKL